MNNLNKLDYLINQIKYVDRQMYSYCKKCNCLFKEYSCLEKDHSFSEFKININKKKYLCSSCKTNKGLKNGKKRNKEKR